MISYLKTKLKHQLACTTGVKLLLILDQLKVMEVEMEIRQLIQVVVVKITQTLKIEFSRKV